MNQVLHGTKWQWFWLLLPPSCTLPGTHQDEEDLYMTLGHTHQSATLLTQYRNCTQFQTQNHVSSCNHLEEIVHLQIILNQIWHAHSTTVPWSMQQIRLYTFMNQPTFWLSIHLVVFPYFSNPEIFLCSPSIYCALASSWSSISGLDWIRVTTSWPEHGTWVCKLRKLVLFSKSCCTGLLYILFRFLYCSHLPGLLSLWIN